MAKRVQVVALVEDLVNGIRLASAFDRVDGVDVSILVTRGRRTAIRTYVASRALELARLALSEPRRLSKVQITTRPLDDPAVAQRLARRHAHIGLHGASVIYRRPVLDAFRWGVLNPHIGLLPEFRGRSVMEWSILSGARTGITTFFMDEGIDTGPRVVLREEVPVTDHRDVASAKAHLFSLDAQMYVRAVAIVRDSGGEAPLRQPAEGTRYYEMSALLRGVVDRLLTDQASDLPATQ